MSGAAAMSLSSIFVVGSALRLRGFKSGLRPDSGEHTEKRQWGWRARQSRGGEGSLPEVRVPTLLRILWKKLT